VLLSLLPNWLKKRFGTGGSELFQKN
jgi:hypothetical protein